MQRFYLCASVRETAVIVSREFYARDLDGAFSQARESWPSAIWIGVA